MPAVQQNPHQNFLCLADLHNLERGNELKCLKLTKGRTTAGSRSVKQVFNIELIKQIVEYIERNNLQREKDKQEDKYLCNMRSKIEA